MDTSTLVHILDPNIKGEIINYLNLEISTIEEDLSQQDEILDQAFVSSIRTELNSSRQALLHLQHGYYYEVIKFFKDRILRIKNDIEWDTDLMHGNVSDMALKYGCLEEEFEQMRLSYQNEMKFKESYDLCQEWLNKKKSDIREMESYLAILPDYH